MTIIRLEDSYLTIRKFGGLGPKRKILYSAIDGFKISLLPARGGYYEYLYLMQRGKKVAKISDFYHKNYVTLKGEIKNIFPDLGYEKFNYWDELKEFFA